MSSHEEEEEVISSPLSSPRSSIFDLDDFDFASPPPERAPGPALIDNLPPFHLVSEPAAEPVTTTRASSRRPPPKENIDKERPATNPDEEPIAESIDAHVHEDGCAHDRADGSIHVHTQDSSAADNQQTDPPAEELPATPQSPDPLTAEPANNGKKRKAPDTSSTAKKKVVIKKARKNDPKKWHVPFVYTDAKSPLVTAPLRDILLHPRAWDMLSPGDQAELSAMLSHDRPASVSSSPPPAGSGSGSGSQPTTHDSSPPAAAAAAMRPNLDYLRSDDSFRFDCARYGENIEEGRHDPDWLAESWTAHERRKRGEFREYLAGKLERDWDVRVPDGEASDGGSGSDGEGEGEGEGEKAAGDEEKAGGEGEKTAVVAV
ncbi:hypothetical protein BR93DRAFT_977096 [Coniochaeta sp. PMI_546]|nr:hypothetical protein BR93DRAFT_977096 [Coniochaeta sp. PMI_546]